MIKFDHEKVNFANSDRIEATDPQFLTFRNNGSNNTGRSVFSQKIETYKSQQKVKLQQDEDQQIPVRNFKKPKNLRAMRSQQKYPGRSYVPIRGKQEQGRYREQKQQGFNQVSANQYQFKNELLRKKIQKLVKNIKNEQKKQTSLQKDIQQLERQLEEDEKQIENQFSEISQLQNINQQNESYLQKLAKNFQQFEQKNDHLQMLVQKIQESLENLQHSVQQEDAKYIMSQKLRQGIVKLESLKTEVTNRCLRIQTEIAKFKQLIEHSETLDLNIRDTAYTKQNSNNSHFTC